MKNILASLQQEHETILRALDAFERFLRRIEEGAAIDQQELVRFVIFFNDFADGWHHAREEEVLLPALTRHGYAKSSGVLLHIRDQHRRERALFFRLKRVVADSLPWSSHRIRDLLEASREIIAFERNHIQKETDLLYPAAAKELEGDNSSALESDQLWFSETHAPEEHVKWLERLGIELAADHPGP
jgi:hemerythrin-like domain-containing protein